MDFCHPYWDVYLMFVMLSSSGVSFVFLLAKTQPTPSDPMIIDYWSPYDHLNPSQLTLFFLLYSISPLSLAGRHLSCHPQFLFIAHVVLRSWNALPFLSRWSSTSKHHWTPLPPPPLTSGQPHISFFLSQFELLFLWAFEFMHLLSLSLSLSIISFWSLVLIEHI